MNINDVRRNLFAIDCLKAAMDYCKQQYEESDISRMPETPLYVAEMNEADKFELCDDYLYKLETQLRHMETKQLVPMYSQGHDITFIMEETWIGDDLARQEVVGWYCGEPDDLLTEQCANRDLVAEL